MGGCAMTSFGVAVLLGLLASVTAQTLTACSGTFGVAGGAYNGSWRVEGDEVIFTVAAQTTGWVGIGFSLDQRMASTDTVVGGIFEGTSFACDGYATMYGRPPNDAQQDIKNVSVTQANGVTTLQFTRLRVTGDSQDLPLDNPFFLLFAWNGPISGVCRFGYHRNTRAASSDMITLPTAQQCPGPALSPCTLSTQAVLLGSRLMFTWMAIGTCPPNITYTGSARGIEGPAISPQTFILPSAGLYTFTLQGYSNGQPVEGLNETDTLYFFGEEGVTCVPSDDGQSYICNWEAVDGVNFTVSEDGGNEVSVTPPFSTTSTSLIVRAYLNGQLVGSATASITVEISGTVETADSSLVFTWEPLNVAGLSYKCSLNGGTQVDCSPPLSVHLVELACGENCLEVEAILDGLTVGSHVLCQTKPCSILIEDPVIVGQNAIVNWTTNCDLTMCSLNMGEFVNCTSPSEFALTSLQENVLEVRGFCEGQPGGSARFAAIKGAEISIMGRAENIGLSVEFTWTATGATGLTYRCSLNGAAQNDCSPPLSIPLDDLACGENCLEVEAILEGTAVTNLTLCNTKPCTVSIQRTMHDGQNVVLFWTTDCDLTMCSLNGEPAANCSSPYSVPITSFQPGQNVLVVDGFCDGQRGVGLQISVDFDTGVTTPPPCTLDTQVELSATGGVFTWTAVGTCPANLTYIGSVSGVAGLIEPPFTLRLRGLPAGFYLTTLQGYSDGQPVEGLNDSMTVYYFGDQGVAAELSADGQDYIFTWTVVDGVTYFVSLNDESEVEAMPPFSTPVAGFRSLVVRVYLNGQLVGNAEGLILFKLYLEKDRYNVYEDDGSVMIRVLASRPAPKNTIVTIQLSDDSAISGMDYLQAGNLTTVLLERDVQVEFSITILNDDIPEERDERFNVALLPREDYEVAELNEAAVFIEDEDALILSLEMDHYDVSEGDGTVTVRAVSSHPAVNDTLVFMLVADGSAVNATDYYPGGTMVIVLPANGTLLTGVFAILSKGESQVEFTINIVDDDIPETREEFRVTLIPEIYILGERSAGQIFIEDDDDLDISVTVTLSSTGTDMTFVWKQLQGVTYQCSFNGQEPEDCSPEGFTVPGNSLRETGNVLVITLYMDSQPVGEQSFMPPPIAPDLVSSLNSDDSATITWEALGGLAYQCSVDGGPPVTCEPGFVIPEEQLPRANHVVRVTAFVEENQIASRVVNVPTCKLTAISPLIRTYLWAAGLVQFRWHRTGNVGSTSCRLDGGEEVPCKSGVLYNMNNITAERHTVEVVAHCSADGERISSEQKNFRSRSGLPSDPVNCQRMSIQNATAEYDSVAETVSISFGTSTPSTCTCRAPALGQRKTGCESGHMFTGAARSIFSGKPHRARVTVICRSVDCGVVNMVVATFNPPN